MSNVNREQMIYHLVGEGDIDDPASIVWSVHVSADTDDGPEPVDYVELFTTSAPPDDHPIPDHDIELARTAAADWGLDAHGWHVSFEDVPAHLIPDNGPPVLFIEQIVPES